METPVLDPSVSPEAGQPQSSLIVLSLAASQERVDRMARFLAEIDEVVSSSFKLPAQSQRYWAACEWSR